MASFGRDNEFCRAITRSLNAPLLEFANNGTVAEDDGSKGKDELSHIGKGAVESSFQSGPRLNATFISILKHLEHEKN